MSPRARLWTQVAMITLLLAEPGSADEVRSGYPCGVAYDKIMLGSGSNSFQTTLYSEPHCAGTFVGSAVFFSVGYLHEGTRYSREELLTLFERVHEAGLQGQRLFAVVSEDGYSGVLAFLLIDQ